MLDDWDGCDAIRPSVQSRFGWSNLDGSRRWWWLRFARHEIQRRKRQTRILGKILQRRASGQKIVDLFDPASDQTREAEASGWQIGRDGMEITL